MHTSALDNFKNFYITYLTHLSGELIHSIVEIGSLNVNGGLRDVIDEKFNYIGLDFVEGPGVDVVLDDPYRLPFESESKDVIITSSCFEHSEMFWIVFLEFLRVLKPNGLIYLNAPSNGVYHRYPVDCWRFYPDSGSALIKWAKYNNIDAVMLESYISSQTDNVDGFWNDFVAVFSKSISAVDLFPDRILDTKKDFYNGKKFGCDEIIKRTELSEDLMRLNSIKQISQRSILLV